MKKLTSMAMALALAGLASSAFAADKPTHSTTVHFTGQVIEPTCSFKSKSLDVSLDSVNSSQFMNLAQGEVLDTAAKNFTLEIDCVDGNNPSNLRMKINGEGDHNILKNSKGTAQGVGVEIFSNGGNHLLPIGTDLTAKESGLENAFLNKNNNLDLVAKYARYKGDVTGGTLATDAVFEITYQ
ncbi:fimbrial protein [Enterobacter huaxiensis]|jgi:major type 1 subunit fimbrin (pilin)|uniref:fimbrial protein n=1 Tax=Enterobacter huaxiensis TaxID=2494702 RepID=UPI000E717D91|nr:fimbrial protein [Enterobacter huaxiensis]UNC52217.1 type 1 fimbrial protein [Enterobacter huaxiensis]